MNACTAIILHPHVPNHTPANSEPCLENRGPSGDGVTKVRHNPGFFLGVASFSEFVAHRERYCDIHDQRRPKELENWEIEALAARRIVNLIDNQGGYLFSRDIQEIRWRAIIAQPECMSDWLDDIYTD